MAIIKCSECGREVSDKAAKCPHCGNPINVQEKQPTPNHKINKNYLLVVVCTIFAIAIGIGCWLIFGGKTTDGNKSDIALESSNSSIETPAEVYALTISDFVTFAQDLENNTYTDVKKYDDAFLRYLQDNGFEIVSKENHSYTDEDGDTFSYLTATLERTDSNNECKIEIEGGQVDITFSNEKDLNSFIHSIKDMGFKEFSFAENSFGWVVTVDGKEFISEEYVTVSRNNNKVSIYPPNND